MDDDIVQNLLWYKGQQAVEIEISLAAATAPPAALAANGDPAVGHTQKLRKISCPLCNAGPNLCGKGMEICFYEGRK